MIIMAYKENQICVMRGVILDLLGAQLHHTRPSVLCGNARHPTRGVCPPHFTQSFGLSVILEGGLFFFFIY